MTASTNTIAPEFNPVGPLPFIARTAMRIADEVKPRFPAFDPEHPDEEILAAFEKVREYRAWAYAQEDFGGPVWPEWPEAIERQVDDLALHYENTVEGTFASTAAGVAARLALLIPCVESDRWVDRCVMEEGVLSLFHQRKDLDGKASQLAQAAYELLYIEWDQALRDYQQAKRADEFAAQIVREIHEIAAALPERHDQLIKLRKRIEGGAGYGEAINRLVRTLAPDAEELLRKVEIMAKELALDEWSAPWLGRDAAFIAGQLDGTARRERLCDRFEADIPISPEKQEA